MVAPVWTHQSLLQVFLLPILGLFLFYKFFINYLEASKMANKHVGFC